MQKYFQNWCYINSIIKQLPLRGPGARLGSSSLGSSLSRRATLPTVLGKLLAQSLHLPSTLTTPCTSGFLCHLEAHFHFHNSPYLHIDPVSPPWLQNIEEKGGEKQYLGQFFLALVSRRMRLPFPYPPGLGFMQPSQTLSYLISVSAGLQSAHPEGISFQKSRVL